LYSQFSKDEIGPVRVMMVTNKVDLSNTQANHLADQIVPFVDGFEVTCHEVSCVTGAGLSDLEEKLTKAAMEFLNCESPIDSTVSYYTVLE
jgi:tRNA U34 5-carboxymethylaminomethyl modifying GTPase MnmE/TrmE